MAHAHIPTVTLEDLQAFQAKHFPATVKPLQSPSHPTHDAYNENLNANADEGDVDDEDDDLGYYPDGVKRTLTDEQIRIFRHSEIHALLRERQIKQENEEYERGLKGKTEAQPQAGAQVHANPDERDGAISAPPKNDASAVAGRKRSADNVGCDAGAGEPVPKRKPQSDSGLPSEVQLDYNEESAAAQTNASQSRGRRATPFMGRKIISYDD
ncbi:DUF3807 domain-containing protein [Aspergillus foveolatus]|uniref:DUF3807 domain-containing protein n=1 Tax=Aspergillus foveolatus TaxID=210207 RepID=UPI003CCD273B